MKILIINDEEQMRRLLRIMLEASEYGVCEAATGKDGITQAAMQRPRDSAVGARQQRRQSNDA